MKKSILFLLVSIVVGCSKTPLTTPSTSTASVQINGTNYAPKYATATESQNLVNFAITGDTFNLAIAYSKSYPDSSYIVGTEIKSSKATLYTYAMTFNGKLKRLFKKAPNVINNGNGTYTISDTFYAFNSNRNVGGVDSTQYRIILSNVTTK